MKKKLMSEGVRLMVSCIVIGGFFWVLLRAMGYEIPVANRDAIMIMIGVLASKFGTIVDFWMGTSKSSSDKTEAMSEKKESTTKTEG